MVDHLVHSLQWNLLLAGAPAIRPGSPAAACRPVLSHPAERMAAVMKEYETQGRLCRAARQPLLPDGSVIVDALPLKEAMFHHALGQQENKHDEEDDKRYLQDSSQIWLRLRGSCLRQIFLHESCPSAGSDQAPSKA